MHFSSQTVLIVNGDASKRDHLAGLLSGEGFVPVPAASSAEALALAKDESPGVALVDAGLSADGGIALLSDLHDLDPDWICAVVSPENNDISPSIILGGDGVEHCLTLSGEPAMLLSQLHQLFDLAGMRAESRALRAALRESEARFLAVFERSLDFIFIKDGQLRYTYINPEAERLFGLPSEAMLGLTDEELCNPKWGPGREAEEQILRGGIHEEDLVTMVGGAEVYYFVTRQPVKDSRGQVCGILTIGRNITEKKMLEKKLVQAQKMEAMGVLAGGIAHDFNNILGAVVGHVELARLMERRGQLAGRHLDEVLKATKRASGLVKQILSFTRQDDQVLGPILLAPIVRECMQLIRAALPTTITIEQHIEDENSVTIANPIHIHQIIMNLATNAGHAMANQRGTLTVRLSRGESRAEADFEGGSYVQISVEDNGCGMNADTVKRIFNPYFTTKAKGVGTGLGLAVVKDIVARSRGVIAVDSIPGKGTIFKVRLPRVDAEAEEKVDVERPLPRGDECILYVDDEGTLVDIGKNLFERLGYKVVGWTDPLEALTYYRAHADSIDIVLTDQTMPNMTGVELAREIRQVRDIPVMICSGFAASPEVEAAREMASVTFLRKPIVIREFAETVRRALDSRKTL